MLVRDMCRVVNEAFNYCVPKNISVFFYRSQDPKILKQYPNGKTRG